MYNLADKLLILLFITVTNLPLLAKDIPSSSVIHKGASTRDKALIIALNAYLPEMMKLIDTPGLNIALARGNKVIWEGAYGYANAFSKTLITPDTVFHSGSMGKTYTAVAIMQLIERGVIKLEDPINKHLPFKVNNPLGGDEITIFHLLTHTSGLAGDAAGSVFDNPRALAETLKDSYAKEQQPIMGSIPTWATQPGKMRLYSNIGVATLGLIIERVNKVGLSYSEYVEKNIMEPLDMASSQYPPVQNIG